MRHPAVPLVAFFVSLTVVRSASAVTLETVPVGNPGNVPPLAQPLAYGAVEYAYRIAKYEVTNAEYVDFLNAVDPAGANKLALYSTSMSTDALGGINFNNGAANGLKYQITADRARNPVVFVSFYDALRFTNWLHNGQGNGDTESGAYTLLGGTPRPSNFQSITRNSGAKWWLPSYNEFYKAAYHRNDGTTKNYWEYPFSSNTIPTSDQPPGSDAPLPANTGNFFQNDNLANGYNDGYAVTGSPSSPSSGSTQNYLTNVGAYPLSKSPYGAFDQGGNASEWYEQENTSFASVAGGNWGLGTAYFRAGYTGSLSSPLTEGNGAGFRVAARPEPSGAPINIAVDFDSTNSCLCEDPSSGPVLTQPGFLSWNASWSFNSVWRTTQFLTDGLDFELQAFRPGPSGVGPPNLGNRIRGGNAGAPIQDLLRDFVFVEGSEGNFLYLTVSGLPVGTYRMKTWHIDSFVGLSDTMQIEVGDKQGDMIAAATTVVADHFPLGTSPQVFEFQVTSPNTIKEIVFRNDDTPPFPGFPLAYRTRLNGFTLVRVPEPSAALLLLTALSLLSLGRHRQETDGRT